MLPRRTSAFNGHILDCYKRQPTYRCQTSFGTSPVAMLIPQCLLNTGAGLNLVNRTLIPKTWAHRIQRESLPKLQTATEQPLHVKEKILLHVRFEYLCVEAWFGIVFNLAVDIFISTSFIDKLIRGIFPSKRKVVSWHSDSVAILSNNYHQI